jgi:hypothetical protein
VNGRGGDGVPFDPAELAKWAAQAIVSAASTDAWAAMRRKVAVLLGRGDPERERLAGQRLDQTEELLRAAAPGQELDLLRIRQEAAWQVRLVDLLQEHPDATYGLLAIATDHSVAAGRDANFTASGAGLAGVFHGPVVGQMRYERQVVASQPVRLAPPPVLLAGRERLLADLDERLSFADTEGSPQVVVLCGLGGVGKTSVAVEYAHRHLTGLRLVWQFRAEEPAGLAAGFSDLAAALRGGDLLDSGDPVVAVHGVLATRAGGWLLVFDNVNGPAAVRGVLPPAGNGQVLITSQSAHWPPGQMLDVPVLDTGTAAAFLVAQTSADSEGGAARELATELGGLPLALEQAAAYMLATGRSIAGYLELFRQRSMDMLALGEPAGYDKRVATTWALAFDQLQRSETHAVGLLRIIACCAPDAIPLSLLLQHRPGLEQTFGPEVGPLLRPLLDNPLAVDEAVAELRRYSLISAPHDGSVSVHRLVQTVTLGQLAEETAAAWRQAAAAIIAAALPADPEQPAAWIDFAALLTHAETALPDASPGMEAVASYLGATGSYTAACLLQQQVVQAREAEFGNDHPGTLHALASLACWTGEAGDQAGARDQYATLLAMQHRVLGPEHPETLSVRAELARWTGMAGNEAGARDQLAALLPVQERVLGPDHPQTLIDRGSLAFWTGAAGDPAGARDQYATLLPVRERVLGPDHPETLSARANLARWTGFTGDAAGALAQYAALLPVKERVLGPEHPRTITDRNNMALFMGRMGDAAGARDQHAVLLPINERISGPEHPETLTTRANLALFTGLAGDAAGARDQYEALLPVRERVSGPDHPDTLLVRNNLARWTGDAGNAVQARDQFVALVPAYERVSGPDHPFALVARAELARWTGRAGDAAGARDQYSALIPVFERVLGRDHFETVNTYANRARWTGEAGDPAAARDQFAAVLPVWLRTRGPDYPGTLTARAELARWTGEAGDATSARDQLQTLLPVRERVSGADHPDTLTARAQLARWTGEAGDATSARDQLQALLPVRERVSGADHPDTLTARAELARWTRTARQ